MLSFLLPDGDDEPGGDVAQAQALVAVVEGDGEHGVVGDELSVYFLARLSPRYPTVEVRVADVCLDAGTAVLLAGGSIGL